MMINFFTYTRTVARIKLFKVHKHLNIKKEASVKQNFCTKTQLTCANIKSVSLNVSNLNSNGLNCSGFDTLDSDVVSTLTTVSGYSVFTTTISTDSPFCCDSGGRFFECDFFMCLTRWSFLPNLWGQN